MAEDPPPPGDGVGQGTGTRVNRNVLRSRKRFVRARLGGSCTPSNPYRLPSRATITVAGSKVSPNNGMPTCELNLDSTLPSHAWRAAFALIRVDLRQGLRKHFAGSTTRGWLLKGLGLLFGFGFFAGLHIGAYLLINYTLRSQSAHPAELLTGLGASLWAFLLFVMLSGGLVRAIVVLHEQDDSSLLLSSPVSPRAVLAARLFGNALQSCLVDGFIIIPYLDVLIFAEGRWRFLWGFPVWFALAVIVTCLDGLFSFGMIRWVGLRRARMLSQAVPFILIFGVTFFAGSLSLSIARMNAAGGSAQMPPEMQAHFITLAHTPLAVLARASMGEPLDFAGLAIFAALLAWATLRLTERAFVEGTQHLAENSAPTSAFARDFRFRSSPLLLEVTKSIRLVVRTPMMIVQCFAQVLTPVGIAFVLGREDPAAASAFFVIFTAGVLAGMFTIAAGTVEEGDELLQMSPRPQRLRCAARACARRVGRLARVRENSRCGCRVGRRDSAWSRIKHRRRNIRHAGQTRRAAEAAERSDHDDPAARDANHQRRGRGRGGL
jgi:hypothetical protein